MHKMAHFPHKDEKQLAGVSGSAQFKQVQYNNN